MSSARAALLACLLTGLGQGWVGQGKVRQPDSAGYDYHPAIGIDPLGTPIVAWVCIDSVHSLVCARWKGTGWDTACPIWHDTANSFDRFPYSFALDHRGRLWLCSANRWSPRTIDSLFVASYLWCDSAWSPEIPVTSRDFGECEPGGIACGGGQVWCVWDRWEGGYPSAVFASRWDEANHVWEEPMQVSPLNRRRHWYGVVAVDHCGTPHVVWNELEGYRILYSFYDGIQWSEPEMVNDSTIGSASWMAAPRVCIDSNDNLHVTYTGAWKGATHRNIFYAMRDREGWYKQNCTNRDTLYDPWYSDVAVDKSGRVWAVWDRPSPGDLSRIFAASFDGCEWSEEERLDDSSGSDDYWPRIAIDSMNNPWVVWMAYVAPHVRGICYNRYSPDLALAESPDGTDLNPAIVAAPSRFGRREIVYGLSHPATVEVSIYDIQGRRVRRIPLCRQSPGTHTMKWDGLTDDGLDAPNGTYFYQLSIDGHRRTVATVLLEPWR
ncbi:MAG: FlgD immunoglobulin-like domain containing protein [candidate division WOR-3 bacterium]